MMVLLHFSNFGNEKRTYYEVSASKNEPMKNQKMKRKHSASNATKIANFY
jgi:hypothetical protein